MFPRPRPPWAPRGASPRPPRLAIWSATLAVGCTSSPSVPPREDPAAIDPAPAVLHRLTRAQYDNTVRDLLGDQVVLPVALEPDVVERGLISIGASLATISPWGVEQYEVAAYDLADQAMADPAVRAAILPCAPVSAAGPDDACAALFIETFGERVFRRPVGSDDLTALTAIARDGATTLESFDQGLALVIAAMLQSPRFLFRAELGEPDPERPGVLRYDAWELASRLSFFLWNTTPDAGLLEAAKSGALLTEEGLAAEVERLLASPRARAGVRSFFTELYELYRLDQLTKDPTIFSHFTAELGPAAREETLRDLEALIFDRDGDFRDIFILDRTFVDRRLAAIYDVRATAREGFGEVVLPREGGRRGLLGQVSVLALHAHPVKSSATKRGQFVRRTLLCGEIPPPPVNVNTALPEPSGTTITLRDRVAEHLTNPACAGCHALMDPIGLGLESFDGIGRFRTREAGAEIDPSGDVDGTPFSDAWSLGQVLYDHPDTSSCLARSLYRYATGNVERAGEEETISQLSRRFDASGRKVRTLLFDVAMSLGFRLAKEPS